MKCVGIICSLTILFVLLTTLVMTPVLISFGRDRKPKPGVDGEGGTRMSRWMEMLNLPAFQTHRGHFHGCLRGAGHRPLED